MYKLNKNRITSEIDTVFRRDSENAITCIPFDSDNTDYQEYLKWVAEGGVPLPADE
jgi:hypothetical protein